MREVDWYTKMLKRSRSRFFAGASGGKKIFARIPKWKISRQSEKWQLVEEQPRRPYFPKNDRKK